MRTSSMGVILSTPGHSTKPYSKHMLLEETPNGSNFDTMLFFHSMGSRFLLRLCTSLNGERSGSSYIIHGSKIRTD